MPAAAAKKTPRNKYYNPKEVPVGTKNQDGTWTYTFTERQKGLLFSSLSIFGNIIASDPDREGFTKREERIIRALREGF